jgi:hypothetical protein
MYALMDHAVVAAAKVRKVASEQAAAGALQRMQGRTSQRARQRTRPTFINTNPAASQCVLFPGD